MRTVYKYPIEFGSMVEHQMDRRAEPVHVGYDPQGTLCVWFEVDTAQPSEPIFLAIVGTGHPIPIAAGWSHAGSLVDGQFVWHIYYTRMKP